MCGEMCCVTRAINAMIKHPGAIAPAVGHMKPDGKRDRNWRRVCQQRHACGAAHILRMIATKLKSCALVAVAF
jgi:hypothetical protein